MGMILLGRLAQSVCRGAGVDVWRAVTDPCDQRLIRLDITLTPGPVVQEVAIHAEVSDPRQKKHT
jgi:hypothetical protein